MTRTSTPVLPMWTIVLDVFGTLLVGGGIFFLVAGGDLMGIQTGDLRDVSIGMIIVGGMLTVPMIVLVVKRMAKPS